MSHLANIIYKLTNQVISTSKYYSNKQHPSANGLHTSPIGAVTLLILVFMFAITLSSSISTNNTYATESTLSLSIDSSTVSMNISPANNNGSFNKSSASTVSASTNNATGYTLSIAAPTNAGTNYDKLINSNDSDTSTNHLDSITSATTEAQFKALEGTAYNGMWGYLPSRYCTNNETSSSCNDNSDFLPAPTTSGDTLDITSTANTTANTYSLTIGARVDSSVKTGSYSNTYIVKLVGNAIPYTITYIDPTVASMPNDVDSTSESETVNISNQTPKKNGYTFSGWCTTPPTTAGITTSCNGTTYAVNDTYTLDETSLTNDLVLYAIWNRNTMQNVSTWQSSIGIGEETTAIDTRDGKTYSVARLCMSAATHTLPALNTCDRTMLWMTQNLDLALGPQGSQTLTNSDSDLNSVSSWEPDTTTMQRPAVIVNHATGNPDNSVAGWTNSNSKPYWAEGGDYYVYTSGNTNTDTIYNSMTACINDNHTEEDCRHYHVGNYYNWSAAVASNDTSTTTTDLTVMPDSICPKGWRLPNGLTGTNGNEIITEFNQLGLANGITANITTEHDQAAGSGQWVNTGWASNGFNNFRSTSTNATGHTAPMYFVRSGYLAGSTLYNYGSTGHLWSSTSQYTTIAYDLGFNSGVFYPAGQHGRDNGFPVRCVAR